MMFTTLKLNNFLTPEPILMIRHISRTRVLGNLSDMLMIKIGPKMPKMQLLIEKFAILPLI